MRPYAKRIEWAVAHLERDLIFELRFGPDAVGVGGSRPRAIFFVRGLALASTKLDVLPSQPIARGAVPVTR